MYENGSKNERLAVAAHLHVLLRRRTGRVTDTEWMAVNTDYALEIVRFARERAHEDGAPDLMDWADKLERITLQAAAFAAEGAYRKPLVELAAQMLHPRAGELPAQSTPLTSPASPRYVGGIR